MVFIDKLKEITKYYFSKTRYRTGILIQQSWRCFLTSGETEEGTKKFSNYPFTFFEKKITKPNLFHYSNKQQIAYRAVNTQFQHPKIES